MTTKSNQHINEFEDIDSMVNEVMNLSSVSLFLHFHYTFSLFLKTSKCKTSQCSKISKLKCS